MLATGLAHGSCREVHRGEREILGVGLQLKPHSTHGTQGMDSSEAKEARLAVLG